jgi:hypothetical protein
MLSLSFWVLSGYCSQSGYRWRACASYGGVPTSLAHATYRDRLELLQSYEFDTIIGLMPNRKNEDENFFVILAGGQAQHYVCPGPKQATAANHGTRPCLLLHFSVHYIASQ